MKKKAALFNSRNVGYLGYLMVEHNSNDEIKAMQKKLVFFCGREYYQNVGLAEISKSEIVH